MDHRVDRLASENHQFFFARVVSSDAGTYAVQVAPQSGRAPGLMMGVPLSSVMAGMLGAKECSLPQPGATVFCFKRDAYSCLILGVVPDADTINEGGQLPSRSVIGAGDGKTCENTTQGYAPGSGMPKMELFNLRRPTDVVDGEHVVANEFGVLLGLFQQFAVLKGSELAQVQAFLLDDLVRVVSHNFEHLTCMGTSKVYQDGQGVTHEINLTHDAMEAGGRPNVKEGAITPPVVTLDGQVSTDDSKDFFSLANEHQVGIDRFKGFVGALGDFVHMILSRPAEGQLRAQDGVSTQVFDRGLASLKVNLDGSVGIRSLAGVALEKTNWIRVPQRISRPEETIERPVASTAPSSYAFDTETKHRNIPFLYFLQLRDYLAFASEGEAYRRFTDTGKFETNNDPSKETALGQELELAPGRKVTLQPKTSGVYLMPNGGIMMRDAWGSALVMEGGNIYIQPAKDLVFQPLRNLVGKVGQNVSIAAQKDIDLSSTSGGFRLKTDLSQYLYSARSGVVIHSDASSPFEYSPADAPVTAVGGIVLHAPNAGIVSNASHSLFKTANNAVIKTGMCLIDATSRVLLRSDDGFDVFTSGDLLLSAGKNLVGFTEGTALFTGLENTAIGMENQTVALGTFGAVHGVFEEQAFDDWKEKANALATGDLQQFSFGYREDTSFDELVFRFPSSEAYRLQEKEDALPQTVAQQEDRQFQTIGLAKWSEAAVNGTLPYPGVGLSGNYAVAELANLQFDPQTQDTYNKAIEHSAIGKIDFADLFKDYTVYA